MKIDFGLKRYSFDVVELEVNPDPGASSFGVAFSVKAERNVENPADWRVTLETRLNPDIEADDAICTFRLVAVGYFHCELASDLDQEPEPTPGMVEREAVLQGGSLLYSASREFFLGMTSRSSRGPVCFPVVFIAQHLDGVANDG